MNLTERVAKEINRAGFKIRDMKVVEFEDMNVAQQYAILSLAKAALDEVKKAFDEHGIYCPMEEL